MQGFLVSDFNKSYGDAIKNLLHYLKMGNCYIKTVLKKAEFRLYHKLLSDYLMEIILENS